MIQRAADSNDVPLPRESTATERPWVRSANDGQTALGTVLDVIRGVATDGVFIDR